ncbi:MAG: sulfotransferase [Candidatus Heimdallarchaeota archaeon]|nr:sulfotransferase [Candidatus Heimdallarchaeota archaeon]MCK4877677.1 sulfotransferase [Candidatus Heimdallarchaeota archaeon]
MFIGYPRSGHSIFGSMLDAHPNIIIAHEQNILLYLKAGFSKDQIFSLILKNSRDFTKAGRQWEEYKYEIPNQWQGDFDQLKLIGDKKGGVSSLMILNDPTLIEKLLKRIKKELVFVHVIRNPYDNITTMSKKHKVELKSSIKSYFRRAEAVKIIKERYPEIPMLDVEHEELISNPKAELERICKFLGIDYSEDYLESCSSIVMKKPSKTRFKAEWTDDDKESVKQQLADYDYLAKYSFDD